MGPNLQKIQKKKKKKSNQPFFGPRAVQIVILSTSSDL